MIETSCSTHCIIQWHSYVNLFTCLFLYNCTSRNESKLFSLLPFFLQTDSCVNTRKCINVSNKHSTKKHWCFLTLQRCDSTRLGGASALSQNPGKSKARPCLTVKFGICFESSNMSWKTGIGHISTSMSSMDQRLFEKHWALISSPGYCRCIPSALPKYCQERSGNI